MWAGGASIDIYKNRLPDHSRGHVLTLTSSLRHPHHHQRPARLDTSHNQPHPTASLTRGYTPSPAFHHQLWPWRTSEPTSTFPRHRARCTMFTGSPSNIYPNHKVPTTR